MIRILLSESSMSPYIAFFVLFSHPFSVDRHCYTFGTSVYVDHKQGFLIIWDIRTSSRFLQCTI